MRLTHPLDALLAARGSLFPWIPVIFATGIGSYFSLHEEPRAPMALAAVLVAFTGALVWWRGAERWQPVGTLILLLALGGLWACARAHQVAAPVLGWRYYGPVEGRIVGIDRSASDRVRLTLDRVVLDRVPPSRTPARVRVSLHGDQGFVDPEPGLTVILTGHLSSPSAPAEPGGFDFQRLAWFDQLGAVGYTRNPVLALAPPEGGLAIFALRMRISEAVQARIPGDGGAFAAALLTGDRSGISNDVLEDLRNSNLAHLLAISGLHMGLLTGFVFAALRYGFALIPPLALRVNAKKLAAGLALGAGAFYLALSGGNVATERAFVMVAVMLVAVLLDRRAVSLRSVALAAMLILILRPEALLSAGFQMSFAATVALVAVFSATRPKHGTRKLPRWAGPLVSLVVASSVAGAATAPLSAAHFGRVADYGLLANLLTVPLMGTLIIPAAVLAGLLSPIGLSGLPLRAMELGTTWILAVADRIASLDGAARAVPVPQAAVLPVLALSVLWLILWPGRARWGGLAGMAAAILLWSQAERPLLYVSPSGGLLGLMTEQGRALSKPRGDGFEANSWLEGDGDLALPEEAHGRWPTGPIMIGGWRLEHLTGRGTAERLAEKCVPGRLVVLSVPAPDGPHPCWVIDPVVLEKTGTLAFHEHKGVLKMETARQAAGVRMWNRLGPPIPVITAPAPQGN